MELASKSANGNKASSHYFLGKKPSGRASLYLRAAAVNQAHKVSNVPPTKENWPEYERLRTLVERLRRAAGFSPWFAIGSAALSCILLIIAVTRYASRTYYYTYPSNYLRVVQNLDSCDLPGGLCGKRYIVQAVVDGVAYPETEMHFKENMGFEAGHTFSWIKFKYIGSEAVTDGWDILRDSHGPVLAPNCKPDYATDHIRCEGGKARF